MLDKMSKFLLVVAIVLTVANTVVVIVYRNAITSAVAYTVGQSIGYGNGVTKTQTDYTKNIQYLADELATKGEIELFDKTLVEKVSE